MTFKIAQYAWFRWFDENGDRIFDRRALFFEATAEVPALSTTHITLNGNGYYLEVEGVDLQVDGSGQLTSGTVSFVAYFDAASDVKMVDFSDAQLDVASYLDDYLNDVTLGASRSVGFIFDASMVPAQSNGEGIGTYGANDGDDTMFGSAGSDELIGFAGNDKISGNGGNDVLWGDEGNDSVFGGAGNDDIKGYTGNGPPQG